MQRAHAFADHLAACLRGAAEDLEAVGLEAIVASAGRPRAYHADDQHPPFHTNPQFRHWCPLEGPHHLLLLRADVSRPQLLRHHATDYWHEPPPAPEAWWADHFEIHDVESVEGLWEALGRPERTAYVGDEPERAAAAGLFEADARLTARLEWRRALKSRYEVGCIEEATATAARGHAAARHAFLRGASELEIHHAYVAAAELTDDELPYPSIVALDEKAAVLHYQNKRRRQHGRVLLIDVGAGCRGYACDITRTHTAPGCDERFVQLRDGVEALQRELCAGVRPGLPFGELHHQAHLAVAEVLREVGLLSASPEEAVERKWSHAFFPHGLGHQLGIQVHDVGGHLADRDGAVAPPPEAHPKLRNTRTLEPGQVVTIEPGLYFIEPLLRPLREGGDAARFDWTAIDALAPLGGIRIEDDVLVTKDGHRNLTRERLLERAAA